jgi:hypothetical protein
MMRLGDGIRLKQTFSLKAPRPIKNENRHSNAPHPRENRGYEITKNKVNAYPASAG